MDPFATKVQEKNKVTIFYNFLDSALRRGYFPFDLSNASR